jgi:mono/diheme cytochrome c family protein
MPMRTTLFLAVLCLAAGPVQAAEVDFVKDIKPILEKSCVQCHGPKKANSDLRLDSRAAVLKGSRHGAVVVPGKAADSLLAQVLQLPADDSKHMPAKGDPLSGQQINLVRDWINQGLKWPDGITLESAAPIAEKTTTEPKTDPGMPISDAEKAAVARVEQLHGLALRLAQNTNLLQVDFSIGGRDVKDADLALLKDLANNLVELNLGGTQVTDAGLAPLEGLTHLTRLQLQNTKITDAGLVHLQGLHQLHSLNLYGTAITDKGLESLKGLKDLKQLYLWQTKVTAEGARQLGQAIPGLSINRGYEADNPVAATAPGKTGPK